MKYFLDTEFIEGAKQRRVLGFKVGPPVPTIDLISLALVAEDGREFYALNAECELDYAWDNEWVRQNVLLPIWEKYAPPIMRGHSVNFFCLKAVQEIFKTKGLSRGQLRWGLLTFVHAEAYEDWVGSMDEFFAAPFTDEHEFWAYYADYDWVAFCQLFGSMINLPKGFPMFCHDLKQEMARQGISQEHKRKLCPDPEGEHDALVDARWDKRLHAVLEQRRPWLDSELSRKRNQLSEIEHLLQIPALDKYEGAADKIRFMLKTLNAAARGEKISNKPEDYY